MTDVILLSLSLESRYLGAIGGEVEQFLTLSLYDALHIVEWPIPDLRSLDLSED